jgi:hypothetical protein
MSTCLRRCAICRPRGYLLVNPQNTVTGGGAVSVSTLLRTAVTPYHSPRGMCVTTMVLSTCARSAICRFSAGLTARAYAARSVSMLSSHGQPARALSQWQRNMAS